MSHLYKTTRKYPCTWLLCRKEVDGRDGLVEVGPILNDITDGEKSSRSTKVGHDVRAEYSSPEVAGL